MIYSHINFLLTEILNTTSYVAFTSKLLVVLHNRHQLFGGGEWEMDRSKETDDKLTTVMLSSI